MIGHSKRLVDLFRRWGTWGSPGTALSDTINLVGIVDRHYGDEELETWGAYAFADGADAGGGARWIPAVAIFAGYKQVFIRKWLAWSTIPNFPGCNPWDVIAITKLINSAYNPVANGPIEFLPGLLPQGVQPTHRGTLVPASIIVGGSQNAHQSATLKGFFTTSLIGPKYPTGKSVYQVTTVLPDARELIGLEDPPLIINPFEVVYASVSDTQLPPATQPRLHCSIFWSEREVAL